MRRKKVQSNPKEASNGVSAMPDTDMDAKIQSILSRIQRMRRRLDHLKTELEDIERDLLQEEAPPSDSVDPEQDD